MKTPWIFFILSLLHAWVAAIFTCLEIKSIADFSEGVAIALLVAAILSLMLISASKSCDCQDEEEEDKE